MPAIVEEKKEEKAERKVVSKKTSGIDKWKKKKWFKIHASPEFDKKELGETPAEKPKQLEKRKIIVSLSELTNQKQKRHITVIFEINDIQGQDAYTEVIGHEIHDSYMGRILRRRNSKMQTVQTVATKENKSLRIKTIAISSSKLEADQETAIRNIMIDRIDKEIRRKEFGQAIQEIIFGVLAAKLFKDVKNIAPLKRVEIVKSQLVEGR